MLHQQNYVRLLQLRQTADRLDAQIKTTVSKLAEAREELLASPWTELSPTSRQVPMHELLSYAKRISKFSLPPNYRGPPPAEDEAGRLAEDSEGLAMTNGVTRTPAIGNAGDALGTPVSAKKEPEASQEGRGAMWETLPENTRLWLDHMKNAEFVPWPNHDLIRGGALGDIQGQIERGEDPWVKLTPDQQEEADKEKREEELRLAEDERRERVERERRRHESVRETLSSGSRVHNPGPQLTGFGMFADDDDE